MSERCTQVVAQFFIFVTCLEGGRCPEVPVFADKPVNLLVFPDSLRAGAKHNQFALVGNGHARPVNGLVAQPGAFKLSGIQVNDDFFQGLIQHVKIDLQAKAGRLAEYVQVVADVQSSGLNLSVRLCPADTVLYIHKG